MRLTDIVIRVIRRLIWVHIGRTELFGVSIETGNKSASWTALQIGRVVRKWAFGHNVNSKLQASLRI